jgi:hypothetical protein
MEKKRTICFSLDNFLKTMMFVTAIAFLLFQGVLGGSEVCFFDVCYEIPMCFCFRPLSISHCEVLQRRNLMAACGCFRTRPLLLHVPNRTVVSNSRSKRLQIVLLVVMLDVNTKYAWNTWEAVVARLSSMKLAGSLGPETPPTLVNPPLDRPQDVLYLPQMSLGMVQNGALLFHRVL